MARLEPITEADEWYIGENKVLHWIIRQQDDDTLQDITAWTGEFRLANGPNDVSFYDEATSINGAPANGDLQITSAAADTIGAVTKPGTYYYELWRTNAGAEAVLAYGPCTIRGRIP